MRDLISILASIVSIAAYCFQPQHEATVTINVAAMYTFAGGLDRPERQHFNAPFWATGTALGWRAAMDEYIAENVAPDLAAGADTLVWVKPYGMEAVGSDDRDQWKIVGWRDNGEAVRSRAFGPSELADAVSPTIADEITAGIAMVAPEADLTIVYIGLPPHDAPPSVWSTWAAPLLDIDNVAVGLDSLGACSKNDAGYKLAKMLVGMGVIVYAEPNMPFGEADHIKELGVRWACIDDRYATTRSQGERWDRPRELGPLLVLLQGADRFEELGEFRNAAPMHGDITFALSTRGVTQTVRQTIFGGAGQ